MATTCFSSIKAQVARFTRLDRCGLVVEGASSAVVTDSFIRVGAAMQIEDGQEFLVKNANGDLCVNEKDCPTLKRIDLTIDLCNIDPDLVELLTGANLLTRDGTVDGFDYGGPICDGAFALELWTRSTGGACVEALSIYWVFPFVVNGALGDLTFENGPLTLQIKANTKAAADSFGNGPFNLLSSSMTGHIAMELVTTTPPAAACGATTLALAS